VASGERVTDPAGGGPRDGIPEYRARDLIRLALHESVICGIAVPCILDGLVLGGEDLDRVFQAVDTIRAIAREVRYVRAG
jgi:hypothetical protein